MIHEYVSKHLHTKFQQLHIAVTICLHPIVEIEYHFLFYMSIIQHIPLFSSYMLPGKFAKTVDTNAKKSNNKMLFWIVAVTILLPFRTGSFTFLRLFWSSSKYFVNTNWNQSSLRNAQWVSTSAPSCSGCENHCIVFLKSLNTCISQVLDWHSQWLTVW